MTPSPENVVPSSYALRIEGCAWLDDLTIEQVWAVLKAAYQHLQPQQELLFITLLPSGDMPAKCVPRSMFDLCMATPAMLADALAPLSRMDQALSLNASILAEGG